MRQKWAFFSFSGRMRRREYWLYSVPVLLFSLPLVMIPVDAVLTPLQEVLIWCVLGVIMLMTNALNIKRLHDRNKSAWWVVLTFVPVVGPIFVLIELGILSGTKGVNNYGEDPKQPHDPNLSPDADDKDDTMTMGM